MFFFLGGGGSYLLRSDLQVVCVWYVSSVFFDFSEIFLVFLVSVCLPCCKSTPHKKN